MKGNKKKELIEEIVGRLKDHELPYREGSWEKFASKYGTAAGSSSNWKYWSAAAAVLLCFGVGYWGLENNNTFVNSPSVSLNDSKEKHEVLAGSKDLKESIQRSLSEVTKEKGLTSEELYLEKPFTYSKIEDRIPEVELPFGELNPPRTIGGHDITLSSTLAGMGSKSMQLKKNTFTAQISSEEGGVAEAKEVMNSAGVDKQPQQAALHTNPQSQTQRDAARLSQLYASQHKDTGNSIVLNKGGQERKWEMGAFVSPASTSESITLGGGVALAYHVSNKVSIRSGASIQHYGAVSGNSPITPATASNSFVADAPNYISQPTLNNSFVMRTADAKSAKSNERVSGKILTVDIPVDVRYAINKHFYTSVGVSYVGVLDQERSTIYETNNTEYKQKSTEKNVDDKGMNGFVNFSIGRKQQVGKLSISVEPYYKVPLGGLRSSDLNYSNGGVKIITSF